MSELIVKDNALVRAELDTQITTAKAYPRNVEGCIREAMMMATMDQETAESCIYALPRGDGFIKGESIRLAEIMASSWGNMHIASRITANDGKTITAEAVAWDLEKNIKIGKEVKRSILGKNRNTYSADMQVATANAAASIAMRNAIFSVVPKAFVKRVYDAAIQMSIGDQKTASSKLTTLFDKFKKMGIAPEKILTYFGKTKQEEITKEEFTEMIGIGTSIKDKIITLEQAFVYQQAEPAENSLDSKLKQKESSATASTDSWVSDYDNDDKA